MNRFLLRKICNSAQRVTLSLFSNWNIYGAENIPASGSIIVISNHLSNIDPSIISASLPRPIWFLAKSSLFKNPIARVFLNLYGAFPVNRSTSDISAIQWILDRLKEDQAVVIFPEGKRNYNGLQKADNSFAKLAIKSNTYILPIGITGTENMQYVTRVFNPTGKITIKFGKPFKIISKNEKITKENMNSINESIMMEIAQLLPPKYQGIYKDKSYKEKFSKNKIFQYYRKDMEKLCVE